MSGKKEMRHYSRELKEQAELARLRMEKTHLKKFHSELREAYDASHQTYGYRRIQVWLARRRNHPLNHKTGLRLMRKMGLRSIARLRRPYRQGTLTETEQRYPNHLARNFAATQPNQKWGTDITFVHTQQGWGYLPTIKDLYDGFIVAHQFGSQNSVDLVERTLQQAWVNAASPTGFLFVLASMGAVQSLRSFYLCGKIETNNQQFEMEHYA